MKKYLGTKSTAFLAILLPFLYVLPLSFAVIVLTSSIEPATIFIAIFCIVAFILLVMSLKQFSLTFYSWGDFQEKKIVVKSLLHKKYEIEYEKCVDVGVGFYIHGFTSHDVGVKEKYIYLSYNSLRDIEKCNINTWQPKNNGIKIGFDKKIYCFLLEVLPTKMAKQLRRQVEETAVSPK